MRELIVIGAAAEALIAALGLILGGVMAMAGALVGTSVAFGAQIVAVARLRPAMKAEVPEFTKQWVSGIGIRFGSFMVVAALIVGLRSVFPPAWVGAGYVAMMLLLLFLETRFLK